MTYDQRMMSVAEAVAGCSADPSTKTGCVLVGPAREIRGAGFNRLPEGVGATAERLLDRPTRLAMTVHAEVGAVLASGGRSTGCTAYVWPWPPCAPCAAVLVQAGVVRVLAPAPSDAMLERWGDSMRLAEEMLEEAGVELSLVAA